MSKEKTGEGTWSIGYDTLPESKWRYWVIAFTGNGNSIYEIDKISAIIDTEFEYGLTVNFSGENQSGKVNGYSHLSPHHVANYNYTFIRGNQAAILKREDLKKLSQLYQLYLALDKKYGFVEHAIDNYSAIRKISLGSNLIIIGYFSILESLVTHKPRTDETLDSIMHQIHTKMTILAKMYDTKVVVNHEYETMQRKKLWSLLYSYRSDLAHGSPCEFSNGKYKALINRDAVADFLKQNIKKLLVLAIKSPDFLADLREC